jgi:hypothetical protein
MGIFEDKKKMVAASNHIFLNIAWWINNPCTRLRFSPIYLCNILVKYLTWLSHFEGVLDREILSVMVLRFLPLVEMTITQRDIIFVHRVDDKNKN